jgi:aminoglycoside phosphotransferase (APT) family kinase protein
VTLAMTKDAIASDRPDGVPDGAPPPVFSKGRDLDHARRAMEPWLAATFGVDGVEICGFDYPAGAGVSNETILIDLVSTPGSPVPPAVVLRVHPAPANQLFLDPDLRMQYDLLDALGRHTDVRVAKVFGYEEDPSILGLPFFVMERLRGRVPVSMPVYNATGFLVDAMPEQRRRLWEDALEQLCRIATVPVEILGCLARSVDTRDLDGQIDYWERCVEWSLGDDRAPQFDDVRAWLGANRPARQEVGLAWGDARIGNVMFDGRFEVAGVMDWEQASLGGPMLDLAWWLLFDDYHSVGHGLPRLEGLGGREETIDIWTERTGHEVHDLHWYEVFAGYRLATLAERSMRIGSTAGRVKQARVNPFLEHTCALLQLPAPEVGP